MTKILVANVSILEKCDISIIIRYVFISATSIHKKNIIEPVIEESHVFEYSPEQIIQISEGDAPLISTEPESSDANLSPPFVRPPIEDRSKYEKLVQGVYDMTSNSSSEEDNIKTKKRKKINIPEKLQSVYKTVELPLKSLRSERTKGDKDKKRQTSKTHKRDSVDIDSDDSIGSASDLKADEDRTEVAAKEDTISESIRTCGSSAYHAECESMATRDEYFKKPPKPRQRKIIEVDQNEHEDLRFVGHVYGEKPLLMDDELDSDCESKFEKWEQTSNKNITENKWVRLSSSVEDTDVFALAPFEKPRLKNKIKNQTDDRKIIHIDTSEIPQTFIVESFADFSSYQENENSSIRDTPSNASLNPFLIMDTPTPTNINTPESNTADVQTLASVDTAFQASFSDQEFACEFPEQKIDLLCSDNVYYTEISQERLPEHNLSELFPQVLPDFTKEIRLNDHFELDEINNQKPKKDKKRDKYQLIDDEPLSDKGEGALAKPVKLTRNTHSYKKVNIKPKKSSLKLKTDGGFSNMSFEDFPVDERSVIESSIMPYEVLRSPQQEEKKFGSKRLGNPFS